MTSERTNVSAFATWVGNQLRVVKATAATNLTAAKAYADQTMATTASGLVSQLQVYADQAAAKVKADIEGNASGAFDTLGELQAALQADQSGVAAVTTALGKRVAVDSVQTFTTSEQAQGRANINAVSVADLGATEVDYVALAVTALNG